VAWPPRSPDLTPLHFFQWGHIKALIDTLPFDSEVDLIARIVEATIRQQPGIFEHTSVSAVSRQCVEVGGHTFEHLL